MGRLTAQRFIGAHDWYREGCDHLVRIQDLTSGFWKGVGGQEGHAHVGTSFALLFLAKGRRPVVLAKLRHGDGEDWNHHRHDVANLTAYTETRWKRDLSWQIVDQRSASTDDLLEAPVLFLSGREALEMSDDQVRTLRAYVDQGGFLFAEACCQGQAFDQAFRALLRRVFPEPELQLRLLPAEHPVWRAEQPVDPELAPPLWGLDVGCRTSVIYCPQDLSCYWELAQTGRQQPLDARVRPAVLAAQAVGVNVLAYATNREIKFKLERTPGSSPVAKAEAFRRATLQIALLRHAGESDAAPGALPALQQALASELGMRIDADRHELSATDAELFQFHLVFLHGRNDFRFSQTERQRLREFLVRGGTVLADAVCGSEAFARALRRELAEIWPQQPLERVPASDPLFTTQFNGFDIRRVKRRDPEREAKQLIAQVHEVEPELEGLRIDGRWGVIFSPFDLSCALENHESLECRGYVRADAAKIAINVVLYSLH